MDNSYNLIQFHESITEELRSTQDRVRNLIKYSHHGEDGSYKEAILRKMIKRSLSPRYTIGTGFIVKTINGQTENSRQIDILIFDSSYPTLFSEGDFYIVTPNSVKAAIEVKTDIKNQGLKKTVKKMNELGSFLDKHQLFGNDYPFVGIFSFDAGYSPQRFESTIKRNIINGIENECFINHISLNKDIFMKYWPLQQTFSVYKLKELSFSFFISNVILSVTDQYIENELETWFPEDKERKKLFDIKID